MKVGLLTSYLNGASIAMLTALVAMMNTFACHLIGPPRSSTSSMAHKMASRMGQPFCTLGMQLMDRSMLLDTMKVLYKIGYIKTAIIEVVDLRPGLCRVVFAHLQPKLAAPVIAQKLPSEWPLPPPVGRDAVPPFDPATWQAECNDCCLAFGISLEALQEVFVPDSFPLCTTLDGLDLPPTTRQFVEDLQPNPDLPLSHFDRIVVYADGSSLSALRHQPPLFLAEKGQADTWAFICDWGGSSFRWQFPAVPHRLAGPTSSL